MTTEDKPKDRPRRSRGDGGISEYAPGKYRAYLDIGSKDGKRKRKTFTSSSKKDLVKQLNEFKAQQQKGQLVADSGVTLDTYWKRYKENKKAHVKATTLEGYEYIYDYHIQPELGDYKLQKVTPVLLNDYFTSRLNGSETREPLSGTSVKKHKALLHNIFKAALYEDLLYSNPVERTLSIKSAVPDVRALSIEEVQDLLQAARAIYLKEKSKERDKKSKKNQLFQIYHIVYLALATGLRRGELIALKWDCIDEDNNTLSVRETIVEVKGGSRPDTPKTAGAKRTIAIEPSVIKILKEIRQPLVAMGVDKKEDYVFHTEEGKALIPSNLNRAFTLLLKRVSFKCRFHDLRHTHATWLISKGLDVKTISERLGHSDITTTLNKYTHVVKEVDQKAASTIVGLMESKLKITENNSD